VSDGDASDLSTTSRACRARGIWRTTRHTEKRATLHRSKPGRPINQVSAWQAERESPPTRATSSGCRGCYEETATVEFRLNGPPRRWAVAQRCRRPGFFFSRHSSHIRVMPFSSRSRRLFLLRCLQSVVRLRGPADVPLSGREAR